MRINVSYKRSKHTVKGHMRIWQLYSSISTLISGVYNRLQSALLSSLSKVSWGLFMASDRFERDASLLASSGIKFKQNQRESCKSWGRTDVALYISISQIDQGRNLVHWCWCWGRHGNLQCVKTVVNHQLWFLGELQQELKVCLQL